MKAVVHKVNFKRGFVAYDIEGYDYGWLEVLDSVDLENGDEIEGPFTDLGEATIYKKSTGESIDVFIEDYGMSMKKAFEMILR
ncbi:hypothetical protein [Anaerosporobacter sp.]|uniref:hypothetical protein n=1 Tax=Anaerosporobacter sp. TaxID=1872529 RepID=UPI00286F5B23|nr:hypothetical protein [Anaerosporobacter sp.]